MSSAFVKAPQGPLYQFEQRIQNLQEFERGLAGDDSLFVRLHKLWSKKKSVTEFSDRALHEFSQIQYRLQQCQNAYSTLDEAQFSERGRKKIRHMVQKMNHIDTESTRIYQGWVHIAAHQKRGDIAEKILAVLGTITSIAAVIYFANE